MLLFTHFGSNIGIHFPRTFKSRLGASIGGYIVGVTAELMVAK